jgi:uncharacterized protein
MNPNSSTSRPATPAAEASTARASAESSSVETVKAFFAAFGRGDLAGITRLFHSSSEVVAVREGTRRDGQVHGSYTGRAGVTEFIQNIGRTFEPQAFAVEHVIGNGELVFANGSFTHRLKSNGKLFSSEWALKCTVQGEQIVAFHFYEDSAALVAADPSLAG